MDKFYNRTMKLKNHRKTLGALTMISTPNEAINLLIGNNTAFCATSVLISVLPDNPIEALSYVPLGLFFSYIARKITNNSLIYTNDYFDTLEEYKKYITDLAEIFKKQNLNDPISISYIFSNICASGLLSYDMPEKQDDVKYPKKEKYPELLGTRIVAGSIISRYTSSFLSDLLNTLGYKSCVLSLEPTNEEGASLTVVGIIENNKKFAYDPTNADLIYTNKSATTYISSNILLEEKPLEYTILKDETYNLNKSRMKNFIEYNICKPETDELLLSSREVSSAIASLAVTIDMSDFSKRHERQMKKIKTLSTNLYDNKK